MSEKLIINLTPSGSFEPPFVDRWLLDIFQSTLSPGILPGFIGDILEKWADAEIIMKMEKGQRRAALRPQRS